MTAVAHTQVTAVALHTGDSGGTGGSVTAHRTHPQLAEEGSCLLSRQLALLPHDELHGLEHVPGHGDIPTDVDVASLLLQCLEHGLGQLLLQHVLHVFLRDGRRSWG